MKKTTPSDLALTSDTDPTSAVDAAWGAVGQRFDRFCLVAGVAALSGMMEDDVQALAGNAHARSADQPGYRCGRTKGRLGLHGGKVALARPRMRSQATRQELPLPSWRQAAAAGRLEEWATSPMLINVATREFGRAVRLPEAGISTDAGSGLSKAAVSRRFEALTEARPAEWMASDPSQFDLPVVQVDGLHMDDTLRTAASIPSAWSRQPPRTPRRFKPCWTTCSSAGSTRRSAGCSSSMARGVDGARGRWREGPGQGDPPDLRGRHPDPALPDPQGPQHHRPERARASRRCPPCSPASPGDRRCRPGRAAAAQSGAPARGRGAGRGDEQPRGARQDPDRHPPGPAARVAPVARRQSTSASR